MIDTISLTIQQKDFRVLDHKRFTPSSKGLFEPPYYEFGRNAYIKCSYNPSKQDMTKYPYLPRLTLIKAIRNGGFAILLKVEFSIPKLLYANNFDEVEESEFGEICWKLKEILLFMGIEIKDIKIIANADVSTVHYSKNIVLTDYTTPYSILKEIAKVNVNRLLDMNQSNFRNEGHAIKYHSNEYEVIFYDKVKDLQQAKISEKRAVEKDNYIQLSLFDTVEMKKPFEVLRMEVRLGSRNKIKDALKKTNNDSKDLCFIKLFSQKVSKDILQYTMNKIESDYPKILTTNTKTNEELFTQLMIDNPKLKYKNILAIVGAKVLLQEQGTREFRKITNKFGKTNWYRFNKEMKDLVISSAVNPFDYLIQGINKFERIRLEDYKDKM